MLARARLALAVEGVNDAENLGALFRNATALGAGGMLLDPTTCDPLSRRCVRVSVGAVFATPWARAPWPEGLDRVERSGHRLVALHPGGDTSIAEWNPPERVALMVGAEGPGLSAAALERADEAVCIPMSGGLDSLNVATAAAIAIHEWNQKLSSNDA